MTSNSGAGYGNHAGDGTFEGQDGAKAGDHRPGAETTGPDQREREQPQSETRDEDRRDEDKDGEAG